MTLDDLEVERHERDRAEEREPDHEADRARRAEGRVAEELERQDRLGGARFGEREQREQRDAADERRRHPRRVPGVGRAAEAGVEDDPGKARGEHDRSEVVGRRSAAAYSAPDCTVLSRPGRARARTAGCAFARTGRRACRTAARPPSKPAVRRSPPRRGAAGHRDRRRSSATPSRRSSVERRDEQHEQERAEGQAPAARGGLSHRRHPLGRMRRAPGGRRSAAR